MCTDAVYRDKKKTSIYTNVFEFDGLVSDENSLHYNTYIILQFIDMHTLS